MTRLVGRAPFLAIVAITAGLAAACGSSKPTGPKVAPQELAGAYFLDTVSVDGETLTPPAINGSLVLTDNTYKEHILLVTGAAPGDTMQLLADSGTYALSGSSYSTMSQSTNGVNVAGTVSVRGTGGDTLDLQLTSPASAAGTYVWVRQP